MEGCIFRVYCSAPAPQCDMMFPGALSKGASRARPAAPPACCLDEMEVLRRLTAASEDASRPRLYRAAIAFLSSIEVTTTSGGSPPMCL